MHFSPPRFFYRGGSADWQYSLWCGIFWGCLGASLASWIYTKFLGQFITHCYTYSLVLLRLATYNFVRGK